MIVTVAVAVVGPALELAVELARRTVGGVRHDVVDVHVEPSLAELRSQRVNLGGLGLILVAGILSASSLFWMLPTTLLGGVSAAAGIAAVNSFANLAGFCSPYLIGWITTLTGTSAIGMYLITAVLVFGALLVFRVPAAMVNR